MPKFKVTVNTVHVHVFTIDAPDLVTASARETLEEFTEDHEFMQKHLVATYDEATDVNEIVDEPKNPFHIDQAFLDKFKTDLRAATQKVMDDLDANVQEILKARK
jgi:hypothetical protein